MQRDTYILAGATRLPFLVVVAVAVELRGKRSKTTDAELGALVGATV